MTVPFITACLVVTGARNRIVGCLHALDGLVDEVVVHDTGSADGARGLLRCRPEVTVIGGEGVRDLLDARNEVLAQAAGQWVPSVDADEVVIGDGAGLRAWLRDAEDQQLAVTVRNAVLEGRDGGDHTAVKLFRPQSASGWGGSTNVSCTPSSTTP